MRDLRLALAATAAVFALGACGPKAAPPPSKATDAKAEKADDKPKKKRKKRKWKGAKKKKKKPARPGDKALAAFADQVKAADYGGDAAAWAALTLDPTSVKQCQVKNRKGGPLDAAGVGDYLKTSLDALGKSTGGFAKAEGDDQLKVKSKTGHKIWMNFGVVHGEGCTIKNWGRVNVMRLNDGKPEEHRYNAFFVDGAWKLGSVKVETPDCAAKKTKDYVSCVALRKRDKAGGAKAAPKAAPKAEAKAAPKAEEKKAG